MARQSSGRRNAEDNELDEGGDLDFTDDAEVGSDDEDEDGDAGRSAATERLWAEARIEPVEIALPTGTGYTLRAYRSAAELTPTEAAEEDEDDPFATLSRRPGGDPDDEETVILDEEFAALMDEDEEPTAKKPRKRGKAATDADDADAGAEEEEAGEEDEAGEEEAVEEEAAADQEEVPVFLSHKGKLLLFRTPESLVEFVKSDAEHNLSQLDSWSDVVERLRTEDVVPLAEDMYELDLVVENLRGGHDAWDPALIIGAGEVARDLGYALRMEPLMTALASGSPLDDLDEALRSAESGGIGGFMARRRVRKIGIQQATLGWRTIIGKISSAVVWRD